MGHPAPAYGYEQPKHNCSVVDVVETAEVCTPTLEKTCVPEVLPIKLIISVEQCYTVTRTVCTESIEVIPNEVCVYEYEQASEQTFEAEGHHSDAKTVEVAQTTQYNVPTVPAVDVDVKVAYPAPKKVCVDKPIDLPRVTCEDLSEEKCIQVPEIEESSVTVDKCTYALGKAACQAIELTLPKQVCVELVYGYAHEEHKHEPAPAPAYPAPHA